MTNVEEFLEALTEADVELQKLGFHKIGLEMRHPVCSTYRSDLYRLRLLYGPTEFHVEFALDCENKEVTMETLFELPEVANYIMDIQQYREDIETSLRKEVFFFVKILKLAIPYLNEGNLKTNKRLVSKK